MVPNRVRSAILPLVPHVVGLLLFGIYFEFACRAFLAGLPRGIYFQSSFTLALVEKDPASLAFALISVVFAAWLFSPAGRGRLSWKAIDRVGGLRWPIFVVALTLGWAYAGYRYNYYFDQSHLSDRWLLVLLMLGTLRSPLLIPIFVFEVLVSRAQFDHPLNALTPIGDEFPLRVLGIVVGCALWNGVQDGLAARFRSERFFEKWNAAARIETHALVYSILCLVGFYYCFAGMGKMMIGESLLDWMWLTRTENLFVSGYLNGWLSTLSETRVLELAEFIRILNLPIAATTLIIELGMVFILARQRATLVLLAFVASLHFGIVLTSGIVFWKWLALDLAFLAWLWLRRNDDQIQSMYSRSNFIVSVLIIGAVVAGFHKNNFAWWNTKWSMLNEVEVHDESGHTYLVDHADFSPHTFVNIYRPGEKRFYTVVFGLTLHQWLAEFLQDAPLERLKRITAQPLEPQTWPRAQERRRAFREFMTRYFKNRNARGEQTVLPFFLPSPAMHNRHLSAPNLYRDQAPVVEVQLRFKEIYYTGSELLTLRDAIVYRVPIARAGG